MKKILQNKANKAKKIKKETIPTTAAAIITFCCFVSLEYKTDSCEKSALKSINLSSQYFIIVLI